VLRLGRGGGGFAGSAGVDVVIIQALGNQHKVGKAEVDGQGDDSGDEIGPDGPWKHLMSV